MAAVNLWGFRMTKEEIQNFINENVNPGLAMHGGSLSVHEFESDAGILYVIMGGGCQGCAGAKQTMMYAVDQMLKEEFSEINAIYDVTDHAKGGNPYYA